MEIKFAFKSKERINEIESDGPYCVIHVDDYRSNFRLEKIEIEDIKELPDENCFLYTITGMIEDESLAEMIFTSPVFPKISFESYWNCVNNEQKNQITELNKEISTKTAILRDLQTQLVAVQSYFIPAKEKEIIDQIAIMQKEIDKLLDKKKIL